MSDEENKEEKEETPQFNEEDFLKGFREKFGASLAPKYVIKNNISTHFLFVMKMLYYFVMPLVFIWAISFFVTVSFSLPVYLAAFAIVNFFLLN